MKIEKMIHIILSESEIEAAIELYLKSIGPHIFPPEYSLAMSQNGWTLDQDSNDNFIVMINGSIEEQT